MFPGWAQILVVVVLVILLFGRGKISSIMGDVAKGIKSFKKGMSDESSSSEQTPNISAEDNSSEDSNSEKK